MEEQLDQGPVVVKCRYCGEEPLQRRDRGERVYQVVIACAECGNEFAAVSRN